MQTNNGRLDWNRMVSSILEYFKQQTKECNLSIYISYCGSLKISEQRGDTIRREDGATSIGCWEGGEQGSMATAREQVNKCLEESSVSRQFSMDPHISVCEKM